MHACVCASGLQELYFRRNPGGPTDWQWSFDTEAWYNTDDLAQVWWTWIRDCCWRHSSCLAPIVWLGLHVKVIVGLA